MFNYCWQHSSTHSRSYMVTPATMTARTNQRILFCIQLQSCRLPLSYSHSESSKKERCILFLLNSHTCDGCGQTFQSVLRTYNEYILVKQSATYCTDLEGQHTGVVTKAFWKNMPFSVSSFFSCGWTSREPSLMSWSSVIMYTAWMHGSHGGISL